MDAPERKPEDILHLSVTLKWSMIQMRRWMRFLGWLSIISGGFLAVISLAILLVDFPAPGSWSDSAGGFQTFAAFLYVIFSALIFIPGLWLVRAADNFSKTLDKADQIYFQEGVKYTARYFSFYGILAAVLLAVYLLAFLLIFAGFATGGLID
jgi:hypothetical protein